MVDLRILHSNCDGYTSKKGSIDDIVSDRQIDILLLNETALKGKRKVKMKNFFSYSKNRMKAKGGVATVISNHLKQNAVKVTEGKEGDEYIITRLDHVLPPVNIINIYGQQESRTSKQEIFESWTRLREDLVQIENSGEGILIVGDMNRAVGNDELGVEGNHGKVSHGGQLIREMVKEYKYVNLNNMAVGGPWTWVQRGKESVKSCLDLAYASENILPFIKCVLIDKDKKFTPRRIIWKGGKFTSVYTDHFSMEIVLSGMPGKTQNMEKAAIWNLGKPGGWDVYESVTGKRAKEIDILVEKENIDLEVMMDKIEKIDEEIKFNAFGKTRIKKRKPKLKQHVADVVVDEQDANQDIIRKEAKSIEDEIMKIKSQNLGRVGNVFKMREVITGPKKASQEPTAIRNPINGELIVSSEEIKNVTLAYCVDNLTKKPVDRPEFDGLELKKYLHECRMEEVHDDELDISKDDFEEVMKKFSQKKTKSYDLLLKAGKSYRDVIFKVCKMMIDNETFPASFRKTILNMIWKQKGPSDVLMNSRFIHMKEGFLSRTCEALVVNKMKQCILESSSKYQVGGQPGHSPDEHIYTIKSLWAMLDMEGSGMVLTLVDIVAFFDRENVYDVMQTLHDIGVNKKAARVWYKLNQGTEVAVKTAGGMSKTAFVGDCIGQGTAGGALVSQANLDNGLMEYFGDSNQEMYYGNVRIQPLAYQDDVMKGSKDVMEAQVGNIRMAAMLQDKGLEAHPDKTSFIVCGSSKFKEQAKEDLSKHPLMFGKFAVKEKLSDKYLGQVLHGGGLEQCALATVQERAGRVKGATLEVKSIIEEFQMQVIGGMMAAWELWEKALIPSLLSGAGTWFGKCEKAIDLCDDLQNFFWRVMLTVPESCPKVALKCETRMLGMKWRVWQDKIFLLMRIRSHGDGSLCKEVYKEGRERGWPGLGKEVSEICEEIGIPDANDVIVPKKVVKEAIFEHHQKDMMEVVKSKTKLEAIKDDDFSEVQEYFNDKSVEKARMAFKVRTLMVPEIPGNFKNKYRVKGTVDEGLLCSECDQGEIMTQSHCTTCPAWSDLREGLDLSDINDLVIFFRKLLAERAKV